MSNEKQVHRFASDEVSFWIEQDSSIHLRALSSHGDPVELTADDAQEIAAALMAAAQKLKRLERPKR